jgi:hypothetical protein
VDNALIDGYYVVYYPHLLVLPAHHSKEIGKKTLLKFQVKYKDFHQQILTADKKAVDFYINCGFKRAGETSPMWIYKGDHQ